MSQLTRRLSLKSLLRPSSLRIDIAEAQALVDGGALLVDVRRQDDPDHGLDGSVRMSPDEVPGRLTEFPRDVPIVLACT